MAATNGIGWCVEHYNERWAQQSATMTKEEARVIRGFSPGERNLRVFEVLAPRTSNQGAL